MILFKLVAVIIAFAIRCTSKYFYRFAKFGEIKPVDGVNINVRKITNKQNAVLSTTYAIPFKSHSVFKLTRESKLDQFFKNIGFASEFQTGQADFDQKVYIASDSQSFLMELRLDVLSRELILKLFQTSCKHIFCDGENLSMYFDGDQSENTETMGTCTQLSKQISDIDSHHKEFSKDPYALKILITEALIWSLAAFAICSFLSWLWTYEDTHLYENLVIWQGIKLGIIIAMILFVFVAVFLKGSSRGHRIFIESFIVLGFSIPLGSIGLISDINIHLDNSRSIFVEAQITDKYEREHRSRRNRWYTYHINVEAINNIAQFNLPRSISVSQAVYNSVNKNGTVRIEIGQGRLKHQWYRSINNL